MSNFTHVSFEGLGISFDLPSVAFSVGSYDVHWYGIIIAFGFALAVLYGGRTAYKWKMSLDGMTDVLIWGTILGVICARLYYVAFEWDYYSVHLGEIPQIWNGGIAIYGGIIGALIGAAIGCKIGKVNFANLLDIGAVSLLIGQGIGRWGNFFNQEAFGSNTKTSLFRMWSPKIEATLQESQTLLASKGVKVDPTVPVHPTFLYESVWCILGFFVLSYILKKHRKFKGEIFAIYGIWYGVERMVVEGLRTDSLYIGSTSIRVSQVLSGIIVAAAAAFLIAMIIKTKQGTVPKALMIDPVVPDSVDDSDSAPTVFSQDDDLEKHLRDMEAELDNLISGTSTTVSDTQKQENEIKNNYINIDKIDDHFDNITDSPMSNDIFKDAGFEKEADEYKEESNLSGWEREFIDSLHNEENNNGNN